MLLFILSNFLILKVLSHILCVSLCRIPFVSGLVKEKKVGYELILYWHCYYYTVLKIIQN